MKKFLKQLSKKPVGEVKVELARAHLIIIALAAANIALLAIGSIEDVDFDKTLSLIAGLLLGLLMVISLATALLLYSVTKTKK